MNLTNPIFHDEAKAREHLERIRWPNGPVCPHCGDTENARKLEGESHRDGLHKCYSCSGHFTVTVGSVFERSKVPLQKWVLAAHLLAASKKGYSAHQLHRTLGVSYKTAWFMMHRLRAAMGDVATGQMGGGSAPVEVDETYWGNKKPKGHFGKRGAGGHHQMKIVSLVERGGRARSFSVPHIYGGTVREILRRHVVQSATVHTDEHSVYRPLHRMFAKHETVNHRAGEYSRGNVTTNTVEGYFSILKRGLIGTFHHVSEVHLQRYIDEFDFRYNTRAALGFSDTERAAMLLKNTGGKRLTYY